MNQRLLSFLLAVTMPCGLLHPTFADPEPVTVRPAPPLASGVWVKGTPTTVAAQKGKVTIVLFWTHLCINCKHDLPYWNQWAREYKNSDVTILSVHTPETASEHNVNNVRRFVAQRGIQFPVVTDNDEKTWTAYGVQSWPTEVLIDKQGRIRYLYDGELNWQGRGEYKTVHALIEKLRAEPAA